ncbi:MAG: RNA recognition motif domain-containing protein [Crocinitomicaceae bacterium]|jgi:RNA recognition motif-containing protein
MTSIFVAKLDFGVTSEQLRKLFEQHGKVFKANVATDRETGKSRGFGFVEMPNREEALNAIKSLDNFAVNGRPMTVKEAEARENRSPRPTEANSRPPRTDKPAFENKSTNSFDPPVTDAPLKTEPRKKLVKDKKTSDSESDNRSKKPKMDAYKKSGKNNRFFDDDDDDELDDDLFSYKKRDEDEDFFDDEDED